MKSTEIPGTNPDSVIEIKNGRLRHVSFEEYNMTEHPANMYTFDAINDDADYYPFPDEDIPLVE